MKEMSLKLAKEILKTAISKAKERELALSIAIVDEKGWLVALHRMDGAPIPTSEIARDKAWTAATFRMPSSDIVKFGAPGAPGYGFNTQNWNDRLTPIPGGVPIYSDGKLIGAIGICGGSPDEDVSLCQNVMEEIEAYFKFED